MSRALGHWAGPGRRRQWRRRALRRGLAVACALGAAATVVVVTRAPHERDYVTVVVAARVLAAGEVAGPGSVRTSRWPAQIVPAGVAHDPAEVVGRRVSVPLSPGEPITTARVRPGSLLAGQPADAVAVHVVLTDPQATRMVHAGDRIHLLGPQGVVARSVVVLQVDQSTPTDFGASLRGAGSSGGYAPEGSGLIVSAGQSVAEAIARTPVDALGRPDLSLVLTAP